MIAREERKGENRKRGGGEGGKAISVSIDPREVLRGDL